MAIENSTDGYVLNRKIYLSIATNGYKTKIKSDDCSIGSCNHASKAISSALPIGIRASQVTETDIAI